MSGLRGYRNALCQEFKKRKQKNARYSLRSFALFLNIAPSTLLKVMNGERHFRCSTASKVAGRLGWPDKVLRKMVDEIRSANMKAEKSEVFWSQNAFEDIADWKTMAVAKLASLKGCRSEPNWIADKLGISPLEADEALKKLLSLNLVERKRQFLHAVRPIGPFIVSKPSAKARRYQIDLLEKASEAVNISDEKIALSLMQMVPFNRENLKSVKSFPWRLNEQVRKKGSAKGTPKDLYCVIVQIFPLTKPRPSKRRQK